MRILAIHGIGRHPADFHEPWAAKLREVLPGTAIDVVGLQWSDEQDQVADRFPIASERLAGVMGRVGVGALEDFRESDAYAFLHSHLYDVFAYCALHELRHYLQTKALLDAIELAADRAEETVVVAHSLGSALTAHLAALLVRLSGSSRFRGALLLAPPLGIRSPFAGIPDPLRVTPDSRLPTNIHGLDGMSPADRAAWAATRDYDTELDETAREEVMLQICSDWPGKKLHFVVNRNDPICSDVRFELGGGERRDIISIKQGYTQNERAIIDAVQHFHEVEFGEPRLDAAAENHDAIGYLGQPVVADALRSLFE